MKEQDICEKKTLREKKGITLIALIITIIVMLILVGVSIQIVVNSNLFNTAKSAGEQTESKYEEDKTFGDNITINGKDYSNLNDYMGEIRLVGQSDGNGLKDYKIYGNSVQNGTPSPSTPVEIQSVGDKTKNLLDFSAMTLINANETAVRGGWEFEFGKDIDVTISYGGAESLPTAIFLAKKVTDGVYGSNIQLTSNTTTISLKSNEKLLVFVGSTSVANSYKMLSDNNVTWIQLEEGTTATEYEPYGYKIPVTATNENGDSVTTNIYLDEPLRKIGDYADFIDFKNGKVVRNIKEYTFEGTEGVSAFSTNISDKFRMFISVPDVLLGIASNIYSAKSNYYPFGSADKGYTCNLSISVSRTSYYIVIYDENHQTVDSLKTFLTEQYNNGNPVKAIYPKTPTEETIDLPTINTLEGKNTITVQTQIQPSDMTAEF